MQKAPRLWGLILAAILGLTAGCGKSPTISKPADIPPPPGPEGLKSGGGGPGKGTIQAPNEQSLEIQDQ